MRKFVIGNVIGNVTGVPKGFKNMRGSKNLAAIALTIKAIRAMPSGQYYIRANRVRLHRQLS